MITVTKCHLPLFYNGRLSKVCQRLLPTTQGSARGTCSATFARVSTATADKRMEALRATAPRATMATLTSPMDAKILTSVTSRRYANRAWAATATICLGTMSVGAREEPTATLLRPKAASSGPQQV